MESKGHRPTEWDLGLIRPRNRGFTGGGSRHLQVSWTSTEQDPTRLLDTVSRKKVETGYHKHRVEVKGGPLTNRSESGSKHRSRNVQSGNSGQIKIFPGSGLK